MEDYSDIYAQSNSNNEILVNVWDYDPQWSVEMYEDGKPLEVTRVVTKDRCTSYPTKPNG